MYQQVRVLDVHGHVTMPPEYMAYAATLIAANGPDSQLEISDTAIAAAQERHLAALDERGIDVQLLGPRPYATFASARPRVQRAWALTTNDLIDRVCRMYPDRFVGMAQLPQGLEITPKESADELERCVTRYSFAGCYLNPDPTGDRQAPGLDDRYWDPVYEVAQRLDVPIFIHPSGSADRRVEHLYANYQINNVLEEYVATQLLSRGDVFSRFPGLRVVVAHAGGALDRWIRSDPHVGQADLSQNLFFDTCAHDSTFLGAAIRQRGVDQMLFGSEVPGSGKSIRPESGRPADDLVPVLAVLGGLSDDDRLKILNANPMRVFPALRRF
jgi:predicted TIM-barrel fold metal-dependent hydrolase